MQASPATILFRNLHIRHIADLPVEHKETRGFSIAKLFSKFDYNRINHTDVFPWSFPLKSFPLAWNLPSQLSRSHRPGAVPLCVPSSARWVASNSSGETLQVIQAWSSLSWFSSLGPIGSEILPWDQPWSNRGVMDLDGLSHVARLAQFEASAGGKGHPSWNTGFGHFPQKVQSCHHAKPSKAMQKIGWAAQLDGPGPEASVPLGSVHAWRGMHSVYIFCIPIHTIHFVARKVPTTHTTFWPFGYLKIRHTLKNGVSYGEKHDHHWSPIRSQRICQEQLVELSQLTHAHHAAACSKESPLGARSCTISVAG